MFSDFDRRLSVEHRLGSLPLRFLRFYFCNAARGGRKFQGEAKPAGLNPRFPISRLKSLAFVAIAQLSQSALTAADAEPSRKEGTQLEHYVAVADALYRDDLVAAKKAAGKLAEGEAESALAKPTKAVAGAKDIAAARKAFKALSEEAVKIAGKEKDYTVMQCTMMKGGGGIWLSADGKVNNPYFGAKMPHCGNPKK